MGVNLTSANSVILYDQDFNPHNDAQAEDRCHRVGQTREVQVVRLVLRDSIEERINEIGVEKLELDAEMRG
jgi:SWI/SNF-related matrix-associated actin-dependent regulator 1 of chromatin subfamily A